jgi:hypothetical protein
MRTNLKRAILTILLTAFGAVPALAWHGDLLSSERDAWIDESLRNLARSGYLPPTLGNTATLSNLEVAELTARAAERVLAQVPGAGVGLSAATAAPSRDMKALIAEFRAELAKMDVEVSKAEERVALMEDRLRGIEEEQESLMSKTGSEVGAFGRGWMTTRRGLGAERLIPPLSRLAVNLIEVRLRSIPTPGILFDFRVRMWTTFGWYYVDEISPQLEVRKLTLSSVGKVGSVHVGDLYKNYTPLTLWNDDPWHYRLKPTYFARLFSQVEELSMTEGPAWHLRGLNVRAAKEWPESLHLSTASAEVLGGRIKPATNRYGNYYFGGQADASFLKKRVGVAATGLLLWDDTDTADAPYLDDFPMTWAQKYRVTSVTPRLDVPLGESLTVKGSFELAGSRYEDDARNRDRDYEDWASRGEGAVEAWGSGSLEVYGLRAEGKYVNAGPLFYSPGAQTLRRTPIGTTIGYISGDELRDFDLFGSRNRSLFLDVDRPSFAPYSRVDDNILPYGDATPNRKGLVAGLNLLRRDPKEKRILSSVGAYVTQMEEITPNLVLVPEATPAAGVTMDLPYSVDSQTNTAAARKFTGLELVSSQDWAPVLGLKDKLVVGLGYRTQKTEFETIQLETKTSMATLDFILPVKWMRWADMSLLWGQTLAKGQEFCINDGPYAAYPFYGDRSPLGTYKLMDLGGCRTFWAWALKYGYNKNVSLTGDVYHETIRLNGVPNDTRELKWRIGYEVSI